MCSLARTLPIIVIRSLVEVSVIIVSLERFANLAEFSLILSK